MYFFDLAVSYTWEYDEEFVDLIEKIFQKSGLTTFIIRKHNVSEVADLLRKKEIQFKAYLDRASDEDHSFEIITKLLRRQKCYLINPHKIIRKYTDKSYMHRKLKRKNFRLPLTYILEPYDYDESIRITQTDLEKIGIPFVVKPSIYSGGGQFVHKDATCLEDIQSQRILSHSEKFLIQEKIEPRYFGNKRAWFRVFWAFGRVIPTWWNDLTHHYETVTGEQVQKYNLKKIFRITTSLARITGIDYFSTEIALTKNHHFILIDYINDQCDMRLRSLHKDGVPDRVVRQFINEMKRKVERLKN